MGSTTSKPSTVQTTQERNTRYVYTTHSYVGVNGQDHRFLAITRLWEQGVCLLDSDEPSPDSYSVYQASPGIDYIDACTVLFDENTRAVATSHTIHSMRAHTGDKKEQDLINIFNEFNNRGMHPNATGYFELEKTETYQEVVQTLQKACTAVANPSNIDHPTERGHHRSSSYALFATAILKLKSLLQLARERIASILSSSNSISRDERPSSPNP